MYSPVLHWSARCGEPIGDAGHKGRGPVQLASNRNDYRPSGRNLSISRGPYVVAATRRRRWPQRKAQWRGKQNRRPRQWGTGGSWWCLLQLAVDLSRDVGLEACAAEVIGTLLRRRLHQVGRCGQERAANAAVLGDHRGTDGVDDDAGRVG